MQLDTVMFSATTPPNRKTDQRVLKDSRGVAAKLQLTSPV
jgi:hypothetical protein